MDQDQAGPELSAADKQLLHELTERVRTGGLRLTREGGLLGKLTRMVIESALEGVALAPASRGPGLHSRRPSSRPAAGHPLSASPPE
jgi:hypothetical protein